MFAVRRIIARPLLRVATRQIHVTPRRFASADQPPNMNQIESMMNDPQIRDTFEKLSRHPPAIAAMQKMGEVIKSKGLDTTQPPSKMDIMKLMMDSEFRDAATTLTTEMQNAGVEINPDVFMKMMQGEK
ncbi:Ff.00g015070.m01.CDS01 [Fusarium sp. VM40]|nr:Ff.00g015070.m01.CDS01 [Fusarium sp. VM40]